MRASDACLAYGNRKAYVDLKEIDADADLDPKAGAAPEVAKVAVMAAPMRAALRNSLFNPSQILVRSERARAVGGCDERIVFSQEYSLALRLARRWPFLKLDQLVALVLGEGPGRLSGNMARQLQRVTLACANFLEDCTDIEPGLRHFACRRAAGRAWKWRRRIHGAGLTSPWFWRNLGSYVPLATATPPPSSAPAPAPSMTGRPFDRLYPRILRRPWEHPPALGTADCSHPSRAIDAGQRH